MHYILIPPNNTCQIPISVKIYPPNIYIVSCTTNNIIYIPIKDNNDIKTLIEVSPKALDDVPNLITIHCTCSLGNE